MSFPLYCSTQRVTLAELSRPCRVIRFRLGARWLFFLRAMEIMIPRFDAWHQVSTRDLNHGKLPKKPMHDAMVSDSLRIEGPL
jgi:hypothetical protein